MLLTRGEELRRRDQKRRILERLKGSMPGTSVSESPGDTEDMQDESGMQDDWESMFGGSIALPGEKKKEKKQPR